MATLQEAEPICGIHNQAKYSFDHAHNRIQLTDYSVSFPILEFQGTDNPEIAWEINIERLAEASGQAELQARKDYLRHCPDCRLFLICNPTVSSEMGRGYYYPVIVTKLDDPQWTGE